MGLLDLGQALAQFDQLKRRIGLLASNPGEFAAGSAGPELGNAGPYPGGLLSVMPQVREQAINEALKLTPGLLGATVYHGSPYQFEKFDASKIGTGEGAQAYGYGHYVAENPGVAKTYAETLGPQGAFDIVDDLLGRNAGRSMTMAQVRESIAARPTIASLANDDTVVAAVKRLMPNYKPNAAVSNAALNDYRLLNDAVEKVYKANVYKIDLPDEAIAKMLDWDKPLSQQPEAVKAAMRASKFAPDESVWPHYTGQQMYYGEMQANGPYGNAGWATNESRPAVSTMLQQAGIPGIKYLDQGSRHGAQDIAQLEALLAKATSPNNVNYGMLDTSIADIKSRLAKAIADAGKATYNYVVFPGNEGLLKILGRE